MWTNCRIYNADGSQIWQVCADAEAAFDQAWVSARLPHPPAPPLPPQPSASKRQRQPKAGEKAHITPVTQQHGNVRSPCFQWQCCIASHAHIAHVTCSWCCEQNFPWIIVTASQGPKCMNHGKAHQALVMVLVMQRQAGGWGLKIASKTQPETR